MPLRNTPEQFGLIAKGFHWTIALIVLALLSLGFYMGEIEAGPFKLQVYGLHKSFGLLVLFLVIGRLIWRFLNITPAHLPNHKPWERFLSGLVHLLLYIGIIGMPLSGWFMSSAADFPAPFFGLFDMPDLIAKNRDTFKLMREIHEVFAYMLLGGLFLHFAGAFKHHFIDKDQTLKRMTSTRLNVLRGGALVLIAAVGLGVPVLLNMGEEEEQNTAVQKSVQDTTQASEQQQDLAVVDEVPEWVIDPAQSHISFEATQYGQAFQGQFENFEGRIFFDADDLAHSKADIFIDITSIKTGSDDRDAQAKGAEWFDTVQFPKAHFETTSFEQTGSNQFIANADLTIRGLTQSVSMPFTLDFQTSDAENEVQTNLAIMQGTLTLDRLAFDVGTGEWKSADAIGSEVKMDILVTARPEQTSSP